MGCCFATSATNTSELFNEIDMLRRPSRTTKNSELVNEIDMFRRAKDRKFHGLTQEEEGKWEGEFKFICMGDPQLGFGDQKREEEFSQIAVDFINKSEDIKFVVVCGDHVHNLEGLWAKGDLEQGRKKRVEELKAYKLIYSKLKESIPLVCVCGNHDVGNKPTVQTVNLYKEEFGDDYFTFWCGGVKFYALNSQIIQGLDDDSLARAHAEWFHNESKLSSDENPIHSVAICHIPPFCWDSREEDTNFNWPLGKRIMWLENMIGANINKVYCSHYHRRAGGIYGGKLEVVVTGPIGTKINTKATPANMRKDSLDDFNFRLSRDGFGGLETKESSSSLMIVTVTKEGFEEKSMSVEEVREELGQSKNFSIFV